MLYIYIYTDDVTEELLHVGNGRHVSESACIHLIACATFGDPAYSSLSWVAVLATKN